MGPWSTVQDLIPCLVCTDARTCSRYLSNLICLRCVWRKIVISRSGCVGYFLWHPFAGLHLRDRLSWTVSFECRASSVRMTCMLCISCSNPRCDHFPPLHAASNSNMSDVLSMANNLMYKHQVIHAKPCICSNMGIWFLQVAAA